MHNIKPVQAFCFDLDGTLVDGSRFDNAIRRTCTQLAEATGLDAGTLFDTNSRIWQSYWPTVEEKWTLGLLASSTVSREAWRRTLRECGHDDESLAILATDTLSQNRRRALHLFDDVQELLNFLRPHFPIALITNGASDTQRDTLRVLGIDRMFDAVVISGEVGIAKPEAGIFSIALRQLKVEPDSAWHVGDNLTTDVAGALRAGLTSIWLNRRGHDTKKGDPVPDYEIRTLRDIKQMIRAERQEPEEDRKRGC